MSFGDETLNPDNEIYRVRDQLQIEVTQLRSRVAELEEAAEDNKIVDQFRDDVMECAEDDIDTLRSHRKQLLRQLARAKAALAPSYEKGGAIRSIMRLLWPHIDPTKTEAGKLAEDILFHRRRAAFGSDEKQQ